MQRYTVSFREPSLFDSPYSFAISGYYYDRVYNEYTEEREGTRVTFGRQLNKLWSVNAGFRIEEVGVHDVSSYEPPIIVNEAGEHFLFGLTGRRDARQSGFLPAADPGKLGGY